ncbi:MAG: endonuclease domain-containing protein [Chlorobi bacterium]|nr:endonuclease domain-containing protein [Chlorobiota bacterium]
MKYPEIKAFATKLRNNPTPAEEKLWQYLRRKQIEGRKFLRQHPIIYQRSGNDFEFYIPDFYCASEKLVIELDGKIHEFRKEKDVFRDSVLRHYGLTVLRIKNEELEEIDNVLNEIKRHFRKEC